MNRRQPSSRKTAGGRGRARAVQTRGNDQPLLGAEAPFPELPFPEPETVAGLIYIEQTRCLYCTANLEDDPAGQSDEHHVDRWCPDCGSRYYSTPADEPAMRTRELLSVGPGLFASPGEEEEVRRRRYLLANLSRSLNRLSLQSDQDRGYGFEEGMTKLFRVEGLTYEPAYRRSGTQIDGALELDGWIYLMEMRWRRRSASWVDLVALRTNVKRSSRQTMGLFISVSGWTNGALDALKSESDQAVIVMDGADIRAVLAGHVRMADLLRAKARHLALYGEPYLPADRLAATS